jgi:hypothetical protein
VDSTVSAVQRARSHVSILERAASEVRVLLPSRSGGIERSAGRRTEQSRCGRFTAAG